MMETSPNFQNCTESLFYMGKVKFLIWRSFLRFWISELNLQLIPDLAAKLPFCQPMFGFMPEPNLIMRSGKIYKSSLSINCTCV